MPSYIVNKNAQFGSGDYEVHVTPRSSCRSPRYPQPENQASLGYHETCSTAVLKAKRLGYQTADGCAYCAAACHTG